MRCEVGQNSATDGGLTCGGCGAALDPELRRSLFGLRFVLAQIAKWEAEGKFPPSKANELRRDVLGQREVLISKLMPAPAPKPAETEVIEILDAEIIEPVRAAPAPVPRPARSSPVPVPIRTAPVPPPPPVRRALPPKKAFE